jgi:hypothetical protein
LSVVVVAFNDPPLLTRCLEALSLETRGHDVETLVVSNRQRAEDHLSEQPGSAFGGVRWIQVAPGTTIPRMRTMGIARSHGDIVALIEDDCVVQSGWRAALLASHRMPAAAVGGAVEPGPYRRALDWAVYFCDYGRFMLPLAAGPAVALPGNNVSYKRDSLRALPATLAEEFQEMFVHREWQRQGVPMRTEPAIVVTNVNSWTLAHLTVIPYHHARAFAGRRFGDQPLWRRGMMSLLALLLPALKILRIVRETVSRRRRFRALVLALPFIGVLETSWSIGESVGYLRGPGDSASRWR